MALMRGPQEQEVLLGGVKSAISEFGTGIGHTDNQVMRQDLQKRKEVFLAILRRLTVID